MKSNLSLSLFVFTNLLIVITIFIHIIVCRITGRRAGYRSPQLLLMKLSVFMNFPLVIGVSMISFIESRLFGEFLSMLFFSLCVFNGLSFVYFHFFNMSETARGIHILMQIHRNGCMTIDQIQADYPVENLVELRIDRLARMGEVAQDSKGIYHISSKFLLFFAYLFGLLRRFLGFV